MLKTGVGQFVGQFAVVSQKHKPFAVQVKSAHGKNTAYAGRQKLGDSLPPATVTANVAENSPGLVDLVVDIAL